jgi:hypothetical protein
MRKRYWIGWYNVDEDWASFSESRGKIPPTKNLLGYWCTGSAWIPAVEDWRPVMVAAVDAVSVLGAMGVIRFEWPQNAYMLSSREDLLRFIDVKDADFIPPSDRFPLSDWMLPRFTTPANLKT